MTHNLLQPETLQTIFDAHTLGRVETIRPAKRGLNNLATVINEVLVIRFDVLDLDDRVCRYQGEQTAYAALRAAGIPCPEVVALDLSKMVIPYHYMILTKCAGAPLIDAWPGLSAEEKNALAFEAGQLLARMHTIVLDSGLGRLEIDLLPRWYLFVEAFFNDYAPKLARTPHLDAATYARLRAVINHLRPLVDFAQGAGRLVHGDYQFENVVVDEGRITAILDFEWGKCGDYAWDFKLEEQWESDCPGSAAPILDGYASVRPYPPDHGLRVWLYKLLFHLDNVDFYAEDGTSGHADAARYAYSVRHMHRALVALEAIMQ